MNTWAHRVKSATFPDGYVSIIMDSDVEVRYPVSGNPRLSGATPEQLNKTEISPFGLHWPDLEDLSFRGLLEGEYGQRRPCRGARGGG